MAEESQLVALLKACEAKEQEIAVRKKEIVDIRLERQRLAQQAEAICETLRGKISELLDGERLQAARSGKGNQIQTVVHFADRVKDELSKKMLVLQERQQDVARALEREKYVEEELLAARLEARRVQKLLEERNFQSLLHSSAIEEVQSDELSSTLLKRNRD